MDDIRPVYDFFCPSPVPLKDLASFELALNLWQREVYKLRENKTLHKWKDISNTSVASRMPNLPRSMAPGIDKRIDEIIKSIDQWFMNHRRCRWSGSYSNFHPLKSSLDYFILNHFVDFVADWGGSIHDERTARRMMLCDGIDDDLKFKMACIYFLEEDIVKLWPSVSSYMTLDRLHFSSQPVLYYWVARLSYQLDKVPPIREMICKGSISRAPGKIYSDIWSAMKYFNLSSSNHEQNAVKNAIFVRYFLPKYLLDEVLLGSALPRVKQLGGCGQFSNSKRFLAVWKCIKDKMTWEDLTDIIRDKLNYLNEHNYLMLDPFPLVELWNEMSDDFKQFATEKIMREFSIRTEFMDTYSLGGKRVRELSLLIAILSCASTESREEFWNSNWRDLIFGIKYDELLAIMELCIGDQTEINEFIQKKLSVYKNIRLHCLNLLMTARFSELDEFLRLCFSDERSVKDLQNKLLQDPFFKVDIHIPLLDKAGLFKQFIYSSFEAFEDANHFINSRFFSRKMILYLKRCMVNDGQFHAIMQFIDTFAPSDDFAKRLKHDELVPAILYQVDLFLSKFCLKTYGQDLEKLMVWCLSDEDEITRIKQQINLDELIQGLLRHESDLSFSERTRGKLSSQCMINQVMRWVLGTEQAVEEFKRKYAHDELFAEWFWV